MRQKKQIASLKTMQAVLSDENKRLKTDNSRLEGDLKLATADREVDPGYESTPEVRL